MASVSIDISAAKAHFNNMIGVLKNPTIPMNIIALKGVKDVVDHFDKSEGPTGKWKPIKPSTIKARAKHSANKSKSWSIKPLVNTGLLRLSIRGLVSGNDAVIMSKTAYGNYHNSDEPRTKLPQRKFMWISDKAMQEMVVTYFRYLVKK